MKKSYTSTNRKWFVLRKHVDCWSVWRQKLSRHHNCHGGVTWSSIKVKHIDLVQVYIKEQQKILKLTILLNTITKMMVKRRCSDDLKKGTTPTIRIVLLPGYHGYKWSNCYLHIDVVESIALHFVQTIERLKIKQPNLHIAKKM